MRALPLSYSPIKFRMSTGHSPLNIKCGRDGIRTRDTVVKSEVTLTYGTCFYFKLPRYYHTVVFIIILFC